MNRVLKRKPAFGTFRKLIDRTADQAADQPKHSGKFRGKLAETDGSLPQRQAAIVSP
jgi:hypothetical protein